LLSGPSGSEGRWNKPRASGLAAGLGPSVAFPERIASMEAEKKQVRAFVFDAYGTLFDVQSVVATVNRKFPGQGPALSNGWRTRQLEYTWLRSLMGRYEDFWKVTESALVATCNSMRLPLQADARSELMEAYLHLDPFPEVKQALNFLSGRPLAILSNGTPKMLQAVVESAGLRGIFSQVISANEVKTYKPNPAIYQLAARKLRGDKRDIGFVSSNSWDVAGAKAFGFRTYWVNRSGDPGDELGITPDVTLRTLTDLVGIAKA
jgi:2-haloacid dehalogenase